MVKDEKHSSLVLGSTDKTVLQIGVNVLSDREENRMRSDALH